MKKSNRLFALLLALAMVVTYMPTLAFAAAPDGGADDQSGVEAVQDEGAEATDPEDAGAAGGGEEAADAGDAAEPESVGISVPVQIPAESGVPTVKAADDNELLLQFLKKEVAEELDKAPAKEGSKKAAGSQARKNNLRGAELDLYNILDEKIRAVAQGDSDSAAFDIPIADVFEKTAYSAEELGVEAALEGDGDDLSLTNEALDAFLAKFEYDASAVVDSLLADLPYEMYWFDKTSGYMNGFCESGQTLEEVESFPIYVEGDVDNPVVSFGEETVIRFELDVSADYSDPEGTKGGYAVDTAKTGAAAAFVENTAAIINDNSAKDNLEKLTAYKNAVCAATSYNNDVDASVDPYGDPWQLIWVFDGDYDTNVVCEGYAKAFQFLCDMSDFSSTKIGVSSVTGPMDGGTGAGLHMWNIVHMNDGKNYMADITNCDEGGAGEPDKLFMAGAESGNVKDGYEYDCGEGAKVSYKYDEDTLRLFEESELTMSTAAYDPDGGEEEGYDTYIEVDKERDRWAMPGWDGSVGGSRDIFVWYPDAEHGDNIPYEVKDVEVTEGAEYLDDFHFNSDDESTWWYYRIKDRNRLADDFDGADITFNVKYDIPEDLQGELGKTHDSYEFTVYVRNDHYDVWIDLESNKDDALPGETLNMEAHGRHEFFVQDEEGGWREEREEDLTFRWYYVIGSDLNDEERQNARESRRLEDDKWTVVPSGGLNDARAKFTVTDGYKAAMTAGTFADDEEFYVRVAVVDNNKVVAADDRQLLLHNEYYAVYPLELEDLHVGDSTDVKFEVRNFKAGGGAGYDSDNSKTIGGAKFKFFDINDEALSITDSDGNPVVSGEEAQGDTFTITRLRDWETNFRVQGFWEGDEGEWTEVEEDYHFSEHGYWLGIIDETDVVYADGDMTLGLAKNGLPEGAEIELTAIRGNGEALANKYYTYDEAEGTVTLHGEALAGDNIRWVRLRAKATYKGNVLATTYNEDDDDDWRTFGVENTEREFFGIDEECEVLPGDGRTIEGDGRMRIEDAAHPGGQEFDCTVKSVEVKDGEEFLDDWCYEERDGKIWLKRVDSEDGEGFWFDYGIKNARDLDLDKLGDIKMTVSYTRTEDEDTFDETVDVTAHVSKDEFNVWINGTGDGSHTALPGESVELSAGAWRRYVNTEDFNVIDTEEGIGFKWEIEDGEEFAEIVQDKDDPSKATLKFRDLEEGEDELDEEVFIKVSVYDADDADKNERSSEHDSFRISTEYDEMWFDLDPDGDHKWTTSFPNLEVGESLKAKAVLRKYAPRYKTDKYDNKGYVTVADPAIGWDYDENEMSIERDEDEANTFVFTRSADWDIEFRAKVEYDDNPTAEYRGWDGFECDYRLEHKDYDLWFDSDTDDVYTDGSAEFFLNTGNFDDGSRDKYKISFALGTGYWDDEQDKFVFDRKLTEGKEFTVDYDKMSVTVDGTKLEDMAGNDIAIVTKVALKSDENNVLCERDWWFHVREAWYEDDFPGSFDENDGKYHEELMRGWDTYIDEYVFYNGGNSGDPNFSGEYHVSKVEIVSGDSVEIRRDEPYTDDNDVEHRGWLICPVKTGDSTVRVTYTDPEGNGKPSPFELAVHVVNDIYEVTLDDLDGKFIVGPGESVNLRAYGVHKYTVDVDDEGHCRQDQTTEGLTYEWSWDDHDIATLTVDSKDPSKAVLKFKTAAELDGRRGGTTVRVVVKDGGKEVAETIDYYAVEDEYAFIEPRMIDPDVDYKDEQIVDLKTMLNEDGETRQIPGEINYTWFYDEGAAWIDEVVQNGGNTEYNRVHSGQNTTSTKFRITRRTADYTRIVYRAEWGMNQMRYQAYFFNPKNYSIRMDSAEEGVQTIGEKETKTFSTITSGFDGEGYTFTPSILVFDENAVNEFGDKGNFVEITGFTAEQLSSKTTEKGLDITVSAQAVAEKIAAKGLDTDKFVISVLVKKGENGIWVEDFPVKIVPKSKTEEAEEAKAGADVAKADAENKDGEAKAKAGDAAAAAETGGAAADAVIEGAAAVTDAALVAAKEAATAAENALAAAQKAYPEDSEQVQSAKAAVDATKNLVASASASKASVRKSAAAAAGKQAAMAQAAADSAPKGSAEAVTAAKAAKEAAEKAKTAAAEAKTAADEALAAAEEAGYKKGDKAYDDAAAAVEAAAAQVESAAGAVEAAEKSVTDAEKAKKDADDAAAALAGKKAAAKAELDSYKASDYRTEQQAELAKAVEAAKAAIDAAADEAGVAAALESAKTEIGKIKTDAQLTEEEKAAEEQAKKEAEEKAKSVKTVTVNVKTVNASALNKAIKAAGGSKKYVTTVVLGSKVKKIKSKTFAGTKVTTLTLKTKKLTKSGVKGSLKSSKVKTIKVKAGSKSVNKKLVKKYKKYFTKKNAGKKVKVK